ncbi:alkene reductase [Chitinophaga sp. Mgbs1]|uniref:Alkene reductase n=1 Tax=Chitinophaga solisilvae TaxID=1233460 RepID=A0A3S1D3M2_9BACT|nr:alkene reductase [Chitinophaga solisilvae]
MKLLTPIGSDTLHLNNRIVMAPMSRRRADNGIPNELVPVYYSQRAAAGLIIAESTVISPDGMGITHLPALYNREQIAAWKKVTDAVHDNGGKIFVQLVHSGRIGHAFNIPGNTTPVAPSAIAAAGTIPTTNGVYPLPVPEALSTTAVRIMVRTHLQAVENALAAGFDGVEIHAAHGYLLEQFLHPAANQRTDEYGGSIENRCRFLLEIMAGATDIAGADRIGIRISPYASLNGLSPYDEETATYLYLATKLDKMNIRYLHLSDQSTNGRPPIPDNYIRLLRDHFRNWLILGGGFDSDKAEKALHTLHADLIAFGRPFISNPDLVERIRHNIPFADSDKNTYYQGGAKGLIDYPVMIPA